MPTPSTGGVPVPAAAFLTLLLLMALGCPPAAPLGSRESSGTPARLSSNLHAVLINGGGKREINYWSHLDHLRSLLRLLDANGVAPARVAVFSGDGQDPAADLATREGELPPDFGLLPRSVSSQLRPPIEYVSSEIAGIALHPATRDALRTWFEFGGKGWARGWFQYPNDIAVDTLGNVLVADTFNNRVQVFGAPD